MSMPSCSVSWNSGDGVSWNSGDAVSEQFPVGLRVLVVDDDPTCLMILEKMLRNSLYQVTKCNRAEIALWLLRERKNGFDFVLSEVHMPDMDGFKLLEHVGLEMDLPVINEYFRNVEAEAVGMGSGGTGQSDMEEGQLNSRYLGKEKRKEMTPGGERRNKKNAISLEDILRCKEMHQKVAAMHLKVSLSTLKRACRGHGIPNWPPCGEHNQSRPNESPAVVDKEPIPQLNSDMLLPSNQVSATISRESVIVKARFSTVTMKFQLSWPWRMEELKQQVEKRLRHEAENYYICYEDQDSDDDLLIACDEDLQDHISHSSLPGTNSIEVFLKPK